MPKQALIVEDENQIATILSDYLKKEGFETTILSRGDEVLSIVRTAPPDIILLDIMLPGRSGIQVLKDIRKFSSVPVIFITARVEEIDRLVGFEIGADDYICKPFSPREVVARVQAVMRRVMGESVERILRVGPVSLNEMTRTVTVNDGEVKLTPNEFHLLKMLMQQPGRVYKRSQLVAEVQGYSYEGYERAIDSHVKNLRKKIGVFAPGEEIILTVYGVGYRMCSD